MDTLQLNINMIESYNIAKIKTVIKHHDDTLWNTDLENKSTLTLYREHKRKIHEEQQSYDNTADITTLFEAKKTLQKLLYRQLKNNNDQIELQRDLNLLESWEIKWGMQFNHAKCNIMRVSRKRLTFLYYYNLTGRGLDEVKDTKYLGVTISDNLDW